MALPTGTISMSQVNVELGRTSTASISLNETAVRTLAGVASGTISMNNLRGKSAVSWSPAGTASAPGQALSDMFGGGGNDASVTITCNQAATWTYFESGSSEGYADIASGNSATSITFTLPNYGFSVFTTYFSVSSTAGGVTRYWEVTLQNTGFN
jgi:hypothetical protein